jgi:hypothetical protein
VSAELQVRADVTEGADKLVEAVRGVDAVICATGFRRSFDPFAPWKVCLRTNPIGSFSSLPELLVHVSVQLCYCK